jgi:type IV pilus assembly protein PilY1
MGKITMTKMPDTLKSSWITISISSLLALMVAAPMTYAQSMRDYSVMPPLAAKVESNRSIMLTLSVDHQLFMKAYNDFSDLDGDGIPEKTFVESYDYVGYFDRTVCYTHDGSKFIPVGRWRANAADETDATKPRRCQAGQWSGNFLNWATMTRIDLVRQVLYGGYRSTDTPTETILERSYLPNDAHSFAKYVPASLDLTGLAVVPADSSRCGEDSTDASCQGYTFCNTTQPPSTDDFSQRVTEPPLLRVVKGNYMLWDASERYQCLTTTEYYPERGTPDYEAIKNRIEASSEAKPAFGGLPDNDAIRFEPSGANLNDPESSGIPAYPRSPLQGDVHNYIVRVSVCESGADVRPIIVGKAGDKDIYSYECERYGANLKSVGLLQRYGANPAAFNVRFGLLTGSYISNKEYGALRKNIADFSEEINSDGTFTNVSNSIVNNLNALRIVDYRYSDPNPNYRGTYRSLESRAGGVAACDWGKNSFDNGDCRNWGNPFSELLTESYRYLTGAEDPSVTVTGETDLLPGLSIAEWSLPTDGTSQEKSEFSCSSKNVLGINASAVSYDWSEAFAASTPADLKIPGATSASTLAQLTDLLGITGNYFIGHNGTDSGGDVNGQCSSKSISSLGQVRGTCPETPRLEGGYLGAGLAKYIFEAEGINTFGVSLTDAVPRINIPLDDSDVVNGPKVVIVPACHNHSISGNCALVNFKVIEDPILNPQSGDLPEGVTIERAGSYFVSWEDTEQGGDYDVDASGVIRYERLSSGDIVVETRLLYNGTPDILQFGYVISGTSSDGIKFPAWTPGGDPNLSTLRKVGDSNWTPTTDWCVSTNGCEHFNNGTYQRVTFEPAGGSDANFLPLPLQLAATHGSRLGADGHALVSNPGNLQHQLDGILQGIANEPTPGTGASVATTALAGEGLVLSSIYTPEYSNAQGEKVTWVGQLNGLFYKDSLFWEDCDLGEEPSPGTITDADCVVQIRLDDETNQTVFDRYTVTRNALGEVILSETPVTLPYTALKPLWSASKELSKVEKPNEQRNYDDVDRTKRYIFTAVTPDGVQHPTGAHVMDFVPEKFKENVVETETAGYVGIGNRNYRLLDAGDAEAAEHVVRYIRGDESVPGARNRTLDEKPWLLGDIMHSTAALVGRPSSLYDVGRIGDQTYAAFVQRYRNRRLVTYVGGNDGMLHAFNGGFYNYSSDAPGYLVRPVGDTSVKAHALGAELWAYVPYNLLPHLKWLKDPNYSHVYYVDSKVHVFDVNIFSGSDYPGGWGTILVVGMRFGGGPYTLDDGNDDRTMRSAYIIMDVTNPEKPPKLLAEITDEQLGFTTGDVDILTFRRPDENGSFVNPSRNEWYLVFGSGPTGSNSLKNSTSDQNAHLLYLDLKQLISDEDNPVSITKVDLGIANSYVGGVTAMDWNSDFRTDMLYVGVVGTGTAADSPKGALLQVAVAYQAGSLRIDDPTPLVTGAAGNLPFSRAPMVVQDLGSNSYWVYAASGKLMVSDHLRPANIEENRIVGVRVNDPDENSSWLTTSVGTEDLIDVTDIKVITQVADGLRTFRLEWDADADVDVPEAINTPQKMEEYIRENASGWVRRLVNTPELVFTSPTFVGTTFTVSSFSPSIAECQPGGKSRQYWLNLFTGLPQTETRSLFISDGGGVKKINRDGEEGGELSADMGAQDGIQLGSSKAGDDVLTVGSGGELTSEDAAGDLPLPARRAWREISTDEVN